jgi:ankyrin repeat protein
VLTLITKGCNPDTESPRGLTPLLTLLLRDADSEEVEQLVKMKVNVNNPNKYGMTPLMLACRMKDTKSVHVLLRNGASVMQTGGECVSAFSVRTVSAFVLVRSGEYSILTFCMVWNWLLR